MRPLDRRAASALTFLAVVLLAGPPWPPVRHAFAAGYAAAANGLFGHVTFGRGGRVHLTPGDTAPDGRKLEGEVSTDTVMVMSIQGYQGNAVHGLNARRDAYLPLVLLVAAIAAAPLAARQKLRCLLAGVLIETAAIMASMWLFIRWDFALGLGVRGVYELSPLGRDVLDLAFRALLLPPSNRFVIPLVVAAALAWVPVVTRAGLRAVPATG